MTRKEAIRQAHQENALLALGFTRDEAEALRRISMTLQRWHELECGTGTGQTTISVERNGDEPDSKPYKRIQYPTSHGYVDRRYPIADRETGARKRLENIIRTRNGRDRAIGGPDCTRQGEVSAYIQGDPCGAALYIIRPGDVPDGADVNSYYSRGICIY
jgi:hypothetical protein